MPLLKPHTNVPTPRSLEVMQEVLAPQKEFLQKEHHRASRARAALDNNGLDIESVAQEMGRIMMSGEENNKLKIIDTALKVHGALEPAKQDNQINITFMFDGNSKGVAEILIPR